MLGSVSTNRHVFFEKNMIQTMCMFEKKRVDQEPNRIGRPDGGGGARVGGNRPSLA